MGGTMTTTELMQQFTSTGNVSINDYWPWNGLTGTYVPPPTVWYYHTVPTPVECAGDVHVFPCPHCEKCKCGKATVKREKKK